MIERQRKGASVSRHRGAFTLVEVLASMVLVAIILPAAMKGISLVAGLAVSAKQRAEAVSLGELKLAELLATGEWEDGDSSGDFSPDMPDYRWSAEVREWQDTTLLEIELNVQWTRRGDERSVALTTLAYSGSR